MGYATQYSSWSAGHRAKRPTGCQCFPATSFVIAGLQDRLYKRVVRIAALDVGDARIGVAVCDELGLTTRGIGVVRRRGGLRDLDAVAQLLAPYTPDLVVVGLPLNMDGTEGLQAAKARRFAERLAAHTGLAVEMWDERLSTVEAHAILRETGVRPRGRRGMVDQVAAAGILRSYLEGRR